MKLETQKGFTQHHFHSIIFSMFFNSKTTNKRSPNSRWFSESGAGFSLVETLVYVVILSILILTMTGFAFWFNYSNKKVKAEREVLEGSKNAIETMTNKIKRAESIYTPTTNSTQLSLQTYDHLPDDETSTFVDFFLCQDNSRICFKQESQNPVFLTPETIKVEVLEFTRVLTNEVESVRINLSAKYNGSLVELTSTASLRKY